MLEELLQYVARGGIHSTRDLFQHFSISETMLEAMLEDLARLGYLRRVEVGCEGGHCSSCSNKTCSITGLGQVWSLTAKGSRAAAQS